MAHPETQSADSNSGEFKLPVFTPESFGIERQPVDTSRIAALINDSFAQAYPTHFHQLIKPTRPDDIYMLADADFIGLESNLRDHLSWAQASPQDQQAANRLTSLQMDFLTFPEIPNRIFVKRSYYEQFTSLGDQADWVMAALLIHEKTPYRY